MTELALGMLVERLLWPVPRVRWEAARSIAGLVRRGNGEAKQALLDWMNRQRLESEAIVGLCLIDGFDLGQYFRFSDVAGAVRAPSHLADYLLKKNLPDSTGLFSFRYRFAPDEPAVLPPEQVAWFERYKRAAVPPIFSTTLAELKERTGWPFQERWECEWRGLQATHSRPMPDHPWYFSAGDRESVGQFDIGQRELYVSAYLRVLAHAALRGPMPHEAAEMHSLLALTMNRGLADLQPIARPAWSQGLAGTADEAGKLARQLWYDAAAHIGHGEAPLHLRIVDHNDKAFIELDVSLVIGNPGFTSEFEVPSVLRGIFVGRTTSDFAEVLLTSGNRTSIPFNKPLEVTQLFHPAWPGRFHFDIAGSIRLASSYLFGSGTLRCTESAIHFEVNSDVLSRWIHWYSDWAPTIPRDLNSTVCSVTTVIADELKRIAHRFSAEIGLWINVKHGMRPNLHSNFEISSRQFWLPIKNL